MTCSTRPRSRPRCPCCSRARSCSSTRTSTPVAPPRWAWRSTDNWLRRVAKRRGVVVPALTDRPGVGHRARSRAVAPGAHPCGRRRPVRCVARHRRPAPGCVRRDRLRRPRGGGGRLRALFDVRNWREVEGPHGAAAAGAARARSGACRTSGPGAGRHRSPRRPAPPPPPRSSPRPRRPPPRARLLLLRLRLRLPPPGTRPRLLRLPHLAPAWPPRQDCSSPARRRCRRRSRPRCRCPLLLPPSPPRLRSPPLRRRPHSRRGRTRRRCSCAGVCTSPTTRCGCSSASTSRWPRTRSSPCSAPTAPASPPC